MNRMGDINWNLKPLQPVLYLARSDRKTITRLSEAKNIVFNEASEKVFELDFSLPYYIEKNGQMIKNPNIDKIGVMMLIKMELGEREEWFILSTPSTSTGSEGDEHNYKAFSTANQMSGVSIRGYSSEQPRILSDYLDILISSSGETYWTKGYVDGALDAKFRSFEFDSGNLLQAIYELANKFEAIVEFDSVKSKVNMYAKEKYGRDEKLVVSHDNYLVQATKTEDALAMVTQMVLYGSDGLTINRISPTGANYIEDFSYFLQGFEYDFENEKVISSSKFMSDELALALVKYSQLVYSKGELFREYLDEIESIELELIPKIIQLNDLKTELNTTKNSIDIWLTANNGKPNHELNEKRDELELAISNLESYMESRKKRIAEIAGESYLTDRFIQYGAEGGLMGLLKEEMLLTNNFSSELLDERANFIIKKDYTNDSIIDDRDLLEEGIKEFERLKEPKIDVSMDMLNILDLIEAQRDWNRLKLGDKIRIVSPEIDLDVYAHINEVTYEFEDGKIKVNITNISRAMSRKDAFLDLMYKANTASNSIQVNKDSWSKGKDANDKVNAILNNVWDATKNKISGGVYSTVEISDRGILSRDPDDPDNTYLVLLNGLLAITQDGGKSWKNAITNMGVIAERLYGQIITGQNLTIGDADGILQFVGNKGIVSDSDGNMVMKIGLVEEATKVGQADKYGILLFRGSTNKVYLTQEDGLVIQKASSNGWENVFSADIDGNFTAKDFFMVNMRIVNAEIAGQGVYLDSQDGIRVDGAGMRQIMINADKGIEMLDIVGNRVFYLDTNGNINVRGINIISGVLAGRDVETIGQSIDDLEVALTDVEEYIDGAFKDSVISASEAKIIENHIETLNNEKTDIDAHYTTIYSDTNLTGTPKTALFASKAEYDSKHNALVTAIKNAIADGSITPAEKTNVDNKFKEYRTALSDISSKLELAKKAITNKVVEPVDLKATTALNTANSASQSASDALTKANGLETKVTTIEATATDAFANAENAKLIAGNAKQMADKAIENAQTALNKAGTALSNAQDALDGLSSKENTILKQSTAPTNPVSGQLWLDTSNATLHQLKRWSGTAWITATPTTPTQVGAEAIITKSNTAPSHSNGRLWMDTSVTPNVLYRSNGTAWIKVTPTSAGEVGAYTIAQVDNALNNKVSTTTYNLDKESILKSISENTTAISQNTSEIALKANKTYVDQIEGRVSTAESTLRVHADEIASKVSSTEFNKVENRLTTAESTISQTATAVSTKVEMSTFNTELAKKESTIIKQSTAPSSPVVGQLWLDTSTNLNQLKRWTGSTWAKATPTTATEVGAETNIIKSNTAPSSPTNGQLWLDTNFTPNILKRWSGSAWVNATPTSASEVGAETSIHKGTTAPVSPAVGQLWLDTTNPNLNDIKRWDGSAWKKVTPTTSGDIGAEREIIKSNTAPTHLNGRLWLDTTVTPNVLYRSTGSAWVKATPTTPSEIGAYSENDGRLLSGKVTTAEEDINSLKGEIVNKVSTTEFSIFKKGIGNLVSNPTMTGTTVGWTPSTGSATLSVESATDFDGNASTNALVSTSSVDAHNSSDLFDVDPSKMYEFSLWIKNDLAVGLNYVGLYSYLENGSTSTAVTPVAISTGATGTATTNPYFWIGGKITTWRKIVGFLLPAGTNPANIKNLIPSGASEISTTAYIMPTNMRKAKFRFLNWSNGGTTVKTYVVNPRVVETNSDLIIPKFTNLESSITQTNNSISLKVSKTTIDTANKTGIYNDVLNSRVATASHTGYLVIDTGITMTNQMTNVTIQGYNYSGASNSLIDLDVGFYATSSNTFANYSYVNKGSVDPDEVRVAIKNSKVSIILGSPTKVWSYPNILVPKVQVSHGTPATSFGDGWALSTATAISGFTAVTLLPIGKFRSGVNQITNSTFNSYEDPTETVSTRTPKEWEGNGINQFDILDPENDNPYAHILHMYKTGLTSDANLALYSKAIPLNGMSTNMYTFSFDVKITGLSTISDSSAVIRLMTFTDAESTTSPSQTITITKKNIVDKGLTDGNWFRFKYQVPAITAGAYLRVSPFLQRNGDVKLRQLMFEEGTESSNWNQSPSDTVGLIFKVSEVEQKVDEKAIISTVRNSDLYKSDFDSYVSNDKLSEYSFSTTEDLKSGLNGLDATLKKIITDEISAVKTEYSSVNQTARDITLSVSNGGGVNRLINSVGWAGTTAGWTQVVASGGSLTTRQDEVSSTTDIGELEMLGSGSAWVMKNASITQKVKTPLTTQIKNPQTGALENIASKYTISALLSRTASSSPLKFQVSSNGTNFVDVATTDSSSYSWNKIVGVFTPTSEYTHIRVVSTGTVGQTEVTNLMVNDGETPMQWSNHPTELYSASARFDRFGMVISNNTTQNYTKITTDEFAGYAPVNGTMKRIFTLNGTTTEVNNLDATEFISVGTIKIQRINSGGRRGVAFLPIDDDNV